MTREFTTLWGVAAPLMRENIDTDAIISAQAMVGGMVADPGRVLFDRWRYRPDGSDEPGFVLNTPRYRDAKVLVSARNFGCGSSREHAVWALIGYGIRCVVAPSFGEIFYDNAFQNGLLPAIVDDAVAERIATLLEASNLPEVEVDLHRRVLRLPGGEEVPFGVPDERRAAMLEGLDDLGILAGQQDGLAGWTARDRVARPWVYLDRSAA